MAMRFNRSFNVNRVVKRLVRSVLALYVGGTVMTTFGSVMNGTESPFYQGLTLIGWTTSGSTAVTCANSGSGTFTNCITSTTGSGVLAVVGIIAIAQIITEFITW